jgi:DNA-binding MarR family transcriptional regulator
MPEGFPTREQVDRFLVDEIDTVPQLEALLLIWNGRPKTWCCSEIAKALYISPELAQEVIQHLEQHRLLVRFDGSADCYRLRTDSEELEQLLAGVDEMYRRELVRISNLIHEKASRAVRDFASAFRFKME